MKEKYDISHELLRAGQLAVLIAAGEPVLLTRVIDAEELNGLVKIEVVELLEHPVAHLFTVGEQTLAMGIHLSLSLARDRGQGS